MNTKTRQRFRIALAALIIAGSAYVSIRWLFKTPPMIKVLVLLANMAIIYLSIDFVKKQNRKDNYGK